MQYTMSLTQAQRVGITMLLPIWFVVMITFGQVIGGTIGHVVDSDQQASAFKKACTMDGGKLQDNDYNCVKDGKVILFR
jgi:hypothetical protein